MIIRFPDFPEMRYSQSMGKDTKTSEKPRLVLIAGLAGSGYSTALNILEDAGFSAIDNLPFSLINQLISLEVETGGRQVAVSLDGRTSGFHVKGLHDLMIDLKNRLPGQVQLVFLTASEQELARRFNATRRHHPLDEYDADNDGVNDAARGLADAIHRDWELMAPIGEIADITIDTTGSNPTDFRSLLLSQLGLSDDDAPMQMPVFISSFSYRHGIPQDADMVLDMRFLDNPHWQDGMASLTGRDAPVEAFISGNPAFHRWMAALTTLLEETLPRFAQEGRPQFSIAFGCTGGRHRSVLAAETVAQVICSMGHHVSLNHRQIK